VTALTLPGLPPVMWQVRSCSDPAQAAKTLARIWAERQGGLFDQRGGGR
jgi:hypothetical protein